MHSGGGGVDRDATTLVPVEAEGGTLGGEDTHQAGANHFGDGGKAAMVAPDQVARRQAEARHLESIHQQVVGADRKARFTRTIANRFASLRPMQLISLGDTIPPTLIAAATICG